MTAPPDVASRRSWGGWVRTRSASPATVGFAVAAAVSVGWLLVEPTGTDLAAQATRVRFFADHGWTPIDLRWFGGLQWLSYSVLVPPLGSLMGLTTVAVVATVISSSLFGLTLTRSRVVQPRIGAALGALCIGGNLVAGRITFAVGAGFGLAAVVMLTYEGRWRWVGAAAMSLLAGAASPLAALFLGLVAMTLLVTGRYREALLIGVPSAGVLAFSAWLGQAGVMPIDRWDVGRGLLAAALLGLCTGSRTVRVAAVLAGVGVFVALLVPTPVGYNAVRLLAIFAAPVLVATARMRRRVAVPVAAGCLLVVPPLTLNDLQDIGDPQVAQEYFTPLTTELRGLPLHGRVEVPPLSQRWESYYVSRDFPLARGWMTQVDRRYASLFFDGALRADAYRAWLSDNAVQYVAVARAKPAAAGVKEVGLVRRGLPYLHQVWTNADWTVYAVDNPTPIVTPPGRLIAQDQIAMSFEIPTPASVLVRVRWSRFLTLAGPSACFRPDGDWLRLEVAAPGRYRLGSALRPGDLHPVCSGTARR